MITYIATIRHSSVARAREITINGTLTQAKRAAAREFGQEQRDFRISIYEMDNAYPRLVSWRWVSGGKWMDQVR